MFGQIECARKLDAQGMELFKIKYVWADFTINIVDRAFQ